MAVGATLDNTFALLKDVYTDRLVSQTHDRDDLFGMWPTGRARFNGAQIVGALTVGYPGSGGARGPGATVPVPTFTEIEHHRFYPTFQWHAIQVDYDLQKKTGGGGAAAWAEAMATQVDRVGKYIRKDLARQSAGSGSAVRGQIASSNGISGNVITLEDRYDSVNFDQGMRIDIVDVNNDSATSQLTGFAAEENYPTVLGVDPQNGTVTLDTAPTGAANSDYIIGYGTLKLGSGADDTLTNELTGIDGIVSDVAPEFLVNGGLPSERAGTFQGLDPNSSGYWRSQKVNAGGTAYLSPGHLQDGLTALQIFGSEASDGVECIYAHQLQIEKFSDTVEKGLKKSNDSGGASIVRYPTSDGKFTVDGARRSQKPEKQYVTYAGIPLKPCRFLRRDRAYMTQNSSVRKYTLHEVGFWTDPNGSTFHKDFNSRTAYRAELLYMGQLATEVRNSAVLIDNLQNDFT